MKTTGEISPLIILPLTVGFAIAFLLTNTFVTYFAHDQKIYPFIIFVLVVVVFIICLIVDRYRKAKLQPAEVNQTIYKKVLMELLYGGGVILLILFVCSTLLF